MKRPKKRECRLARAKVNSTSSLFNFSDPVPANSLFPGANDMNFLYGLNLPLRAASLPGILSTHSSLW